MSQKLYDACGADHKRLVFIEGAGHGLAFPQDEEKYLTALLDFEKEAKFI